MNHDILTGPSPVPKSFCSTSESVLGSPPSFLDSLSSLSIKTLKKDRNQPKKD